MKRASSAVAALALLVGACTSQAATDIATDAGTGSSAGADATTDQSAAGPPRADQTPAGQASPGPQAADEAVLPGSPTTDEPVGEAASPPPSGGDGSPADASSASEPPADTSNGALQPGTYDYTTDGTMTATGGTPRRLPDTTTLTAQPAVDGEQHTVRDLRDEDGHGQVTETVLEYRDTGVFLSYVKVSSDIGGGIRSVREWHVDPPGQLSADGAGPGWRSEFTMRSSDTTAEVTVEVLREEHLDVGGERVRALVSRIEIVVTGTIEGRQTTLAWVRPSDLLTLKEEVDSEFSSGAFTMETTYRAQLSGLAP